MTEPILGGSSYASQDSLLAHFGLGSAESGAVEVLWPGGVHNRFYDVAHGELVLFPELPCSYTADWPSVEAYENCVQQALAELVAAGILDDTQQARYLESVQCVLLPTNSWRLASGAISAMTVWVWPRGVKSYAFAA